MFRSTPDLCLTSFLASLTSVSTVELHEAILNIPVQPFSVLRPRRDVFFALFYCREIHFFPFYELQRVAVKSSFADRCYLVASDNARLASLTFRHRSAKLLVSLLTAVVRSDYCLPLFSAEPFHNCSTTDFKPCSFTCASSGFNSLLICLNRNTSATTRTITIPNDDFSTFVKTHSFCSAYN